MDKISLIEEFIQRCNDVIESKNEEAAGKLRPKIIVAFGNDIQEISSGLTDPWYVDSDPLFDICMLKQKLRSLLADKKGEKERLDMELEIAKRKQPVLSVSANASTQVDININITQVIESVQHIPEESLSVTDKETLLNYLGSLEVAQASKEKGKVWEKSKEVLTFLADKGADAAIAVLPYLVKGLASCG